MGSSRFQVKDLSINQFKTIVFAILNKKFVKGKQFRGNGAFESKRHTIVLRWNIVGAFSNCSGHDRPSTSSQSR